MPVYQLPDEPIFPHPQLAEPDGLLAIGGDLSVDRLIQGYATGVFPWYNEEEPILWWSPDPRFILYPDQLKVSKSMKQVLRRKTFEITYDQDFGQVIRNCQQIPRPGQAGTWITPDMIAAYEALHQEGWAHSVEVWQQGQLVGGLYGVSLGTCFFGESMFAKVSNASKAGFITLIQDLKAANFQLIDCQIYTAHLASLGATSISRLTFLEHLNAFLEHQSIRGNWGDFFKKSTFSRE
ncbi:MAG: leucyl/phenylalanyl-tRNA--protein transferase [Bacteroidota bacterium]